ncbi:hypothetical protein EMIT043CA1_220009 [Pseudomonas brassicacearum]
MPTIGSAQPPKKNPELRPRSADTILVLLVEGWQTADPFTPFCPEAVCQRFLSVMYCW